MIQETLESRVARLEHQMDFLLGMKTDDRAPGANSWKETVGMFQGDPVVQEMIEESERLREEDRRRTRE